MLQGAVGKIQLLLQGGYIISPGMSRSKVDSAVRPLKGVLQLHGVGVVGVAPGGIVRVVGRKCVF